MNNLKERESRKRGRGGDCSGHNEYRGLCQQSRADSRLGVGVGSGAAVNVTGQIRAALSRDGSAKPLGRTVLSSIRPAIDIPRLHHPRHPSFEKNGISKSLFFDLLCCDDACQRIGTIIKWQKCYMNRPTLFPTWRKNNLIKLFVHKTLHRYTTL